MLHLIFQPTLEESVLQRIAPADVVVLLDDAVFRALRLGNRAESLMRLIDQVRFLVLQEHLAIRGIAAEELVIGIEITDYAGLVDLSVEHSVIKTWN
jgi:tRNA 2-thiouridine synthesizing protein B